MVDPPRTDPRPYLRLAARHLPSIPIRTARSMNGGWSCFVLEVNREWIFRFPRTPEDSVSVGREARLLAELGQRSPVPIPNYEHVVRDRAGRILFVVYRKLKGRHLPHQGLDGPKGRAWAADLVELLESLARFPRSLGGDLGVRWWRSAERVARWQQLYPMVLQKVHPLLPQRLRARDQEYWENYVAASRKARRRTVLSHADLSGEHILVDDRGVTGVIDWESACFEDPVGDLTMLPRADGFADRVAAGRFGDRDPDWRRRVVFHGHTVPVHSILFALEHQNVSALRAELAKYRRTIPA